MNVKKYIIRRGSRSLFTILGICFSSVLLIGVGILFSSFRDYLIRSVVREFGSYHVIIDGDVKYDESMESFDYKDGKYYITFKNINKVYKKSHDLCHKFRCNSVTYNDSLLSLYGLSKNENIMSIFKRLLIFIILFFGFILFFILYNSFKVSLNNRRMDICLFKLAGFDNRNLYKLFIKESLLLGVIGIVIGFIFSIFLSYIIISFLNSELFEVFGGSLRVNIYLPFVIFPVVLIFVIVFFSSLISLRYVSIYKPMELFRINNGCERVNVYRFKIVSLWFSLLNYKRQHTKYKGLIISVFISCLVISVFSLVLKYGLKCLNDYVSIPSFDLKITATGDYNFKRVSNDLKKSKGIMYNYCMYKVSIPREEYLNDYRKDEEIIITNLGGNEVLNRFSGVKYGEKITHFNYNRFKRLTEINIDDKKIDGLKLVSEIPYGFDDNTSTVVNLDSEKFSEVCPSYDSVLIMNTNYDGIDDYLEDLIKNRDADITFYNVKKARQIMENMVYVLKVFFYGISLLIVIVVLFSSFNVASCTLYFRRGELATLKSIGFEKRKLFLMFSFESLMISIRGWLYSVPFIFIINKYLFLSITEVFDFRKMILGFDIFIFSFLISFLCIFIPMIVSYRKIGNNMVYDMKRIL